MLKMTKKLPICCVKCQKTKTINQNAGLQECLVKRKEI